MIWIWDSMKNRLVTLHLEYLIAFTVLLLSLLFYIRLISPLSKNPKRINLFNYLFPNKPTNLIYSLVLLRVSLDVLPYWWARPRAGPLLSRVTNLKPGPVDSTNREEIAKITYGTSVANQAMIKLIAASS